MPLIIQDHIILSERTSIFPYTSTSLGRSKVIPRSGIDRFAQGNKVQRQFKSAVENFKPNENVDNIYLVFKSPWDFLIDIDKLDKGNFKLSSYKAIQGTDDEGGVHFYYEVVVCINKNAIKEFLGKVEAYIRQNTIKGNPKNQSLIANIDEIRAAAIQNFWQEEIAFPDVNQKLWWEVWLSRDEGDNFDNPLDPFFDLLEKASIRVGDRKLSFPEHWVFLMQGTAMQLAASLLYTNKLAELRKPKDTADFYTYLNSNEQQELIDDLRSRVDNHSTEGAISICLLDTGVNIANPLLTDLIPQKNLDKVKPEWTAADNHIQGHGTPMAGLTFYGDLSDTLGSTDRVPVFHQLESIKLIDRNHANDPELYGALTQEGIARGIILNPDNKRIVCMAVTSNAFVHLGNPSSWSSAIDQSLFGSTNEPNDTTIFFVSSGNLLLEERINYPLSNEDNSIEDPAQAFNAITVGAYTLKDQIDLQKYPNAKLMATRGAMSPCNTTSVGWDKEWCRKPDIVLEGGNQADWNGGLIDPDSLLLLSTSKGGIGKSWLTLFSDTSAATALAARFAAELYFYYPSLLPETIRALIVHSAYWTPEMLNNKSIQDFSDDEKKKLFAFVGYGVPNMQKAKHSANNSLSLIIERQIKPFKFEDSIAKTDEFHLIDLPFPTDVLQSLLATQVTLTVTLSYYIEPNPGKKSYDLAASYRSHGLRFKMLDRNESEDAFKARISRAMRGDIYEAEGHEHWILGNKVRDKGSIHKDIWIGTAADLATRNKIAVYPVGGWWKSRKNQKRYDFSVRYSLIITIDTPSTEVDIYTPVLNEISINL